MAELDYPICVFCDNGDKWSLGVADESEAEVLYTCLCCGNTVSVIQEGVLTYA